MIGTGLGTDAITARIGAALLAGRTVAAGRRVGNAFTPGDGRWPTRIERADESDSWLMTLDEEPPP